MSDAPADPGPPGPFDAPEAPVFRCPSCGARALRAERACAYCGSLLSTVRCVSCFALSPREALRCVRCGITLPKEAVGPPGATGRCPDCRVPLVARSLGAVGYAECARCAGLFLRPQAFEAVTRDADTRARVHAVEPAAAPRIEGPPLTFHYRRCPSCGKVMNRTNYAGGSGVVVDVCRADGIWFDRGELTAIVDFLEGGGYDRLKKREKEQLQEEVRSLEGRKRFNESISAPVGMGEGSGPGVGDLLSILADLIFWK